MVLVHNACISRSDVGHVANATILSVLGYSFLVLDMPRSFRPARLASPVFKRMH